MFLNYAILLLLSINLRAEALKPGFGCGILQTAPNQERCQKYQFSGALVPNCPVKWYCRRRTLFDGLKGKIQRFKDALLYRDSTEYRPANRDFHYRIVLLNPLAVLSQMIVQNTVEVIPDDGQLRTFRVRKLSLLEKLLTNKL